MTRFSVPTLVTLFALSVSGTFSSGANAAVIVLNGGMGQFCYQMTKATVEGEDLLTLQMTGSLIGIPPLQVCTMAITGNDLVTHELAGTYNNRGVLYFLDQKFNEAIADFEKARSIDPEIPEVQVNYGAAMVALKRFADGIGPLTKGIEMGAAEIEKAYYNRAIAYEETGRVKEAYYDYLKAAELKPDWEQPKMQLTRFTVRKK
ncbi:MAG: tetratricopeptide repeat protein [Rhodospirillaceae bacterium]|nr:tetratricopeptide repeat protein [Rhodospirillaceae bacterium]